MKRAFLFSILLVACSVLAVQAQINVSGLVQDTKGSVLPYASVVVKETTNGTITDLDGKFELNIDAYPVTVVASFVGYTAKEVVVNTSEPVTISLAEGIGLDEVMVTSTRVIRSQRESAMSMTSMKGKEIQFKAASGQADILSSVPGITAEGGGGEVAANIFVRGLPSGGQYTFNPLEVDGMPVISTFGLNSSAHDVYFRNDLGIKSLDFPRGGSAILYGAGSVAGLINYISKTGTDKPENIIQLELADHGRYKADFFTGGKLGSKDSHTYYALSGFYRYDEGPIVTGLPTQGFQLRGNLKQVFDKGELIMSGQWIDDKVQFYTPFPLDGQSREFAKGNDGKDVETIITQYAKNASYQTPDGMYHTPIGDGVMTRGGYFMSQFKYKFDNNINFDAKLRYARYNHQFNFFVAGSGNPMSINDYVLAADPNATNITAKYTGLTKSIPASYKITANTLLDRYRPMTDMAGEFNFTKRIIGSIAEHNITVGAFFSRSEAADKNIQTSYIGEFVNNPRLIDITYSSGGNQMSFSKNGIYNPGAAYANNFISANRQAFYITNEMKMDRLRIDLGVRIETLAADVSKEGSQQYAMSSDPTLTSNLQNVKWGNNAYLMGTAKTTDWAGVLGVNYALSSKVNLYGNLSKGYFFPQPRSLAISSDGTVGSYETEKIYQTELGTKYGSEKLTATLAAYYIDLSNRRDVILVDNPNNPGTIMENVSIISARTVGAEATWDYKFAKSFAFKGSFTYQNHEYYEHETKAEYVGNKLARQPNLMSSLALAYDNSKVDANFSVDHVGEKYTDDSNNVLLDPVSIFRLGAGYTVKMGKANESLRLGMDVYNLFNSMGITEGNPRDLSQANQGSYFVGRPILPRRVFFRATFSF